MKITCFFYILTALTAFFSSIFVWCPHKRWKKMRFLIYSTKHDKKKHCTWKLAGSSHHINISKKNIKYVVWEKKTTNKDIHCLYVQSSVCPPFVHRARGSGVGMGHEGNDHEISFKDKFNPPCRRDEWKKR